MFIQGGEDPCFDQAQIGNLLQEGFPAENRDLSVFFADARDRREINTVLARDVSSRVFVVAQAESLPMAANTSTRPGEACFFREDTCDPCVMFTLLHELTEAVPDGVLHDGVHDRGEYYAHTRSDKQSGLLVKVFGPPAEGVQILVSELAQAASVRTICAHVESHTKTAQRIDPADVQPLAAFLHLSREFGRMRGEFPLRRAANEVGICLGKFEGFLPVLQYEGDGQIASADLL